MSTSSPSPSPPPPQSPPPSPPPVPTITNPTPLLSSRKPQTIPWTHQETVFLIQIYQQKWYSLKRGQLKANQWEDVATTVASRCGYDLSHPSKTPIQCRHKMEKLRRRYRDEKRRLSLTGGFSNWPFFTLMDSLECGPLLISARPLNDNDEDGGDNEDDEEDEDGVKYKSKSRSINYILQRPMMVNRFAGSEGEAKRRKKTEEEENGEVGKEEGGVAEEIKGFAARMMVVERKKMEMVRETERWRMQMENKRIEMILDSNNKIAHMISLLFTSSSNHSQLENHSN